MNRPRYVHVPNRPYLVYLDPHSLQLFPSLELAWPIPSHTTTTPLPCKTTPKSPLIKPKSPNKETL